MMRFLRVQTRPRQPVNISTSLATPRMLQSQATNLWVALAQTEWMHHGNFMRNYLSRVKVSTWNVFKLRLCRSRRRTTAIVGLSQPPPPYRRLYFQNQTLPVKYKITKFLTVTRPNNKPALQAVSLINFLFSFSFSLINTSYSVRQRWSVNQVVNEILCSPQELCSVLSVRVKLLFCRSAWVLIRRIISL